MSELYVQQIPPASELDLPQSGSKGDDETWLTEPTGCKTNNKLAEANLDRAMFHQHLRTQLGADPVLQRTQQIPPLH